MTKTKKAIDSPTVLRSCVTASSEGEVAWLGANELSEKEPVWVRLEVKSGRWSMVYEPGFRFSLVERNWLNTTKTVGLYSIEN